MMSSGQNRHASSILRTASLLEKLFRNSLFYNQKLWCLGNRNIPFGETVLVFLYTLSQLDEEEIDIEAFRRFC